LAVRFRRSQQPRKPVPRHYFDIRRGGEHNKHPEGTALPNIEAARKEAHASTRDLLADLLKGEKEIDRRVIEIVDESGAVLDRIAIRDVLHGQ
jgi:hypothetical protein